MKKILLCVIILVFSGCVRKIDPISPEILFEKHKSAVVLIAHQFYYIIQSDNNTYYYSPSSEGKIFTSEDEVLKNLTVSTGTGFIISLDGEIITNRHVVNPKDDNYKVELYTFIKGKVAILSEKKNIYNDSIESLKSYYVDNSSYLEDYEKENLKEKYNELTSSQAVISEFTEYLESFNYNDARIQLVSVNIGIAYDNTFVENWEDLQECVVIKESKDENVDLALVQTKNKLFNIMPTDIFNFEDNNPNIIENPRDNKERNIRNPVKVNADVYMIGFNRGFSLANTKQGIKSQFTSGKISQESDGERILYTIPTLEGSSGSPIIDQWGNLVGVNFAKLNDSQGFSFGVPVYEVKRFYDE